MSDIYQIECKECEGSGGIIKARTNRGELILHPLKRCPSCKGSGGFRLVVVEKGCLDATCVPTSIGNIHPFDIGNLDENSNLCEYCGKAKPIYRPLTVAEVEEMKAVYPTSFDLFVEGAIIPGFVYKGQPVRLVPKGG